MLKKSWASSTDSNNLSGVATFELHPSKVSFEMESFKEFSSLCEIIELYREQKVRETIERIKFRINNVLNS